jgi:peptide/nickel transport system substrate-binding protein
MFSRTSRSHPTARPPSSPGGDLTSTFRGRRAAAAVAVVLPLAIGAVTACTTASAPGAATAGKPTLTFGDNTAPASLNPTKDANGVTVMPLELAYAPILYQDSNGSISGAGTTNALATTWQYVGTGDKEFEFTLRRDARFSNGAQVNAKAVIAWLEYFAHSTSLFASEIGTIKSINAVGNWEVQMHFASASPIAAELLTQNYPWAFVSSPSAVADPSQFGTRTWGAGPYEIEPSATVANSVYTFVPNPYYFDKNAVKYSKVVVKIISAPSSMLAAIQSGQLQFAVGDPTTAAAAKSAGLRVSVAPVGYVGLFFLDHNGTVLKPLGDVQVRQAINYAINRRAITQASVGQYGSPTSEAITTDGYAANYDNYYSYDPSKAKSLLAAAGYPNGFTMKIIDLNTIGSIGDPLTQLVAADLNAVGIKTQITSVSNQGQIIADVESLQYPVLEVPQGNLPAWIFYQNNASPAGGNLNEFKASNPVLNDLAHSALTSKNPANDWKQLMAESVILGWNAPVLDTDNIFYSSKELAGVVAADSQFQPDPTQWAPAK